MRLLELQSILKIYLLTAEACDGGLAWLNKSAWTLSGRSWFAASTAGQCGEARGKESLTAPECDLINLSCFFLLHFWSLIFPWNLRRPKACASETYIICLALPHDTFPMASCATCATCATCAMHDPLAPRKSTSMRSMPQMPRSAPMPFTAWRDREQRSCHPSYAKPWSNRCHGLVRHNLPAARQMTGL